MDDSSFESIISTAILTAYPRILTDIPYAKEVFVELSENKIPDNLMVEKLAPELEARYKLINRLLKKSNINQVLEVAAGYSTRGLSLTENNKNFKYVELDLKEVVDRKISILENFTSIPSNLHIISGNALNVKDINQCKDYFEKNSKIAVINEGLLRYLNFDEKKQIALNIHNLLNEYGGVWITCDVTPKKFILNQDKNISNFNKDLSNISDRNNSNWRFESIDHVKDFFGEIGFEIEVYDFIEIKDELTSPKELEYDDKLVEDLLRDAIVVVMKLK